MEWSLPRRLGKDASARLWALAVLAACVLFVQCLAMGVAPAPALADDALVAASTTAVDPSAASGVASADAEEPERKASVASGVYALQLKADASLALDVAGKSAKKGAKLAVKASTGESDRLFYVRSEGRSRYSIQLAGTAWFLSEEKGKVVLRKWKGADRQMWWAVEDGGLSFVSVGTGNSLAVKGDAATAGSRVVTAPAAEGARKTVLRWNLVSGSVLSTGYYRLHSFTNMNLSVAGTGFKEDGNVNALQDVNDAAQCFRVKATGSSYRITSMRSFKVVSVAGASKKNKANVVQRDSGKGKSQLWKLRFDRKGRFVFVNAKSGKALSVKSKATKAKSNVIQRKLDGSKSQAWELVPVARYSVSGDWGLDKSLARILTEHNGLRAAFEYVRDGFSWNDPDTAYRSGKYMSSYNTVRYAKEMIEVGKGSCYCSSSLFMWLARSLGYDADVTVGYLQSNVPGMLGAHSWVEVRKDGVTYVCDPDCERGYRFRNWFMETYDTTPAEYHFW